MEITEVIIRVMIILFFSSAIGFEREKNRSNAGLKTHTLVGVAATLIAITQAQITTDTVMLALTNPELAGIVRSDPARLTAQVISGIGFLGAGTIIVTNKNISGLTTAASIWAVAALGITVGMGYYEIATVGFVSVILILFAVKRFVHINTSEKIIIKYLELDNIQMDLSHVLEKLHINSKMLKFEKQPFGNEMICSTTYSMISHNHDFFDLLIKELSQKEGIISIQSSNI